MKRAKAPGPDDVPVEIWKLIGARGIHILTTLFNRIISDEETPPVWSTSTIEPIWKNKGDVAACANYRPIRLLCRAMKIFERILDASMRAIATITPNQCGFVKGSGTSDAILAVRILLERHREKKVNVYAVFLDLEKAFDRVPHDLIWHALRSHVVPEVYVRWVKMLYKNVSNVVRSPVGVSPPFPVSVCVHQGSAVSPLLFILCMDTVTADIPQPQPWSLLYADYVFLANVTRQQTQAWNDRFKAHDLKVNLTKTEYLHLRR